MLKDKEKIREEIKDLLKDFVDNMIKEDIKFPVVKVVSTRFPITGLIWIILLINGYFHHEELGISPYDVYSTPVAILVVCMTISSIFDCIHWLKIHLSNRRFTQK